MKEIWNVQGAGWVKDHLINSSFTVKWILSGTYYDCDVLINTNISKVVIPTNGTADQQINPTRVFVYVLPRWSSSPRGTGPFAGRRRTNHTAWTSLLASHSQSSWLEGKGRRTNRAGKGQEWRRLPRLADTHTHAHTFSFRLYYLAQSNFIKLIQVPKESLSSRCNLLKCSAQRYILSLSSSSR